MFDWIVYRKRDRLVAESLATTFRSYRSIFEQHGKHFLERDIRQYQGLLILPSVGLSKDLRYRYPNELSDFVITAGLVAEPYYFTAQANVTYRDFVLTMRLSQEGPLVTDPAHLEGRAKTLAQWFVDQGATKGLAVRS